MNGPIRLRQHGPSCFFFTKMWLIEQLYLGKRWFNFALFGEKVARSATFSPKRMSGTTLPEAESPAGSMTA